jgi:hypothetical protein
VAVTVGVGDGVAVAETDGDPDGAVAMGAHALAKMSATTSLLTQLP